MSENNTTNNDNEKSAFVTIGAAWECNQEGDAFTDKNGQPYFRGTMNPTTNLFIFRNSQKSKPADPDWRVMISQKKFKKRTDA